MKNLLLLTFAFAFLLFSCNEKNELYTVNFDQEAYSQNLEMWTKSNFKDYSFSQQIFSSSFGGQPKLTINVKNGVYDSFTMEGEREINSLTYYETVPELYAFIERIVEESKLKINDAEDPMKGVTIEVKYHDTYFYPVSIYCSGFYTGDYVGGLDITINVSDFELTQ
ncbi:DUF6174 domain-containing protein [Flammeovirga sp. SJP92]|uniref:DUF6174 domain-containing protein n=1 Tax=Flammeovirga sp. SJP92 TaxID=1775430 RepID=UPI000788E587|nr:DUF6174 domain-containing protein [Flammeovirga sp. SJP92]KXX68177.1 hypothetical protein AVL50_20485 [Flammeovirga sp. SJP92]